MKNTLVVVFAVLLLLVLSSKARAYPGSKFLRQTVLLKQSKLDLTTASPAL